MEKIYSNAPSDPKKWMRFWVETVVEMEEMRLSSEPAPKTGVLQPPISRNYALRA